MMSGRWRSIFVVALLGSLLHAASNSADVNLATVGAHVDESLATTVIHVNPDGAGAADTNPGTQALPVATIGRAAQLAIAANSKGIGVRVSIAAGTYRETVRLDGTSSDTAAPIVFEAATAGSVVITGSDVWAGWTSASPAGTYVLPWREKWGLVPYPAGWEGWVVLPDLVRRREMVFIGGKRLREVASTEAMVPGTFYVSEDSEQIRIYPALGVNPGTAVVEVARRAGLFLIQNRSNIVIRGLTLRHDNSALGGTAAMTIYNATNILVEDATLEWNNNRGLALSDTTRITVRRTTADNNGAGGIGGYKLVSTLLEDTGTSYNNWRGGENGFTDWDPAGTKLLLMHDAALVRTTHIGNQAYGVWLDTDCVDILIRGMVSSENLSDGVFLEAVQGPIRIESSRLTKNGRAGLLLGNAAAGTLSRSTIVGNLEAQVLISGNPAGRPVDNFQTGQRYAGVQTSGWSITDNTIQGLTAAQSVVGTTLPMPLWQSYVDTLLSDRNSWFNGSNAQCFNWANGGHLDFESWKARSHQDAHSVFGANPVPLSPSNLRIAK